LAADWTATRSAIRTFRLLARTPTDLAGLEAIQLDAAHNIMLPSDSPRHQMVAIRERVILALDAQRTVELCYRAAQLDFDAHLPVFEELVASFELKIAT